MKKNKKSMFRIVLMASAFVSAMTLVQSAFAAEENYKYYNDIVNELQNSSNYNYSKASDDSTPDFIRIHGQMGFLTSRTQLNLPGSLPSGVTMQGVEAKLGIDLFSQNWIAMGGIRSFDQERFSTGSIQMKEFDLEVLYQDYLSPRLLYTVGGGMAARYLDFSGNFSEKFEKSYSTPASIITFGLDARVARIMSLGVQLSYRAALVTDTADDGAIDGAFRITGHF